MSAAVSAAIAKREKDVLIAQLWAARTQIDATLAVLGVPLEGEPTEEPSGECEHPPEYRRDRSTFGDDRFLCTLCGKEVSIATSTTPNEANQLED